MMPIEAIAETNVAPSPDGYVYMLYSAGLIKIGFTHDPVARFDGMRSMHASPISLIWLSTGTTDRERELHQQFSADREKGEWFKPSTALRGFIAGARMGGGMTPAARLAWAEANPQKALG